MESEFLEKCPICGMTYHKIARQKRTQCNACNGIKPDPIDTFYLKRGSQSTDTGLGYLD